MAGGVEDADDLKGFANTSHPEEMLRHPAVEQLLGARLGRDDLAYVVETFGEFRRPFLEDGGYLVLRSRHERRWEELIEGDREAVIVLVRLDGGAAHVAIDASGRRAVYSAAARYAELPVRLREWLYSNRRETTEDWERAPAGLIWVREPDQPNPMSAVIAGLMASDEKPREVHERIVWRGGHLGAEREMIEGIVEDIVGPDELAERIGWVTTARYDINDDGAPELFIYLGLGGWTCGTTGCELLIFEGAPGAWTKFAGMASAPELAVWIDPTTGYKTIYDNDEGLRWTGTGYEWSCYRRCFPH